jgi:hypothetical protein
LPTPDDGHDREPHSLDEWLREFLANSALLPVAIVVVGSFSAIGAGVLLAALRTHSLPAIAALLLLGGMSADFLLRNRRRHGRFGLAGRLILIVWALSVVAGTAAILLGLA